jgi:hypothetical protein
MVIRRWAASNLAARLQADSVSSCWRSSPIVLAVVFAASSRSVMIKALSVSSSVL